MSDVSVLLDTCFLISLLDANRPNHEAAKAYFKFWNEEDTTMYVSVVTICEYCVKTDIPETVLSKLVPIPFLYEDAICCSTLIRGQIQCPRPTDTARDAIKDDYKIIAHAVRMNCTAIVTEDFNSMVPFCQRLYDAKVIPVKPFKLESPFNAGLAKLENQASLL